MLGKVSFLSCETAINTVANGKRDERNGTDNEGIKVERMGVPYRMWSTCSGRDYRVFSSPPVIYKDSQANILKQITSLGRSPL